MFSLNEIQRKIGYGELSGHNTSVRLKKIIFDSRQIIDPQNSIFLAIKTTHRDGHAFIESAYSKGVRHFWISTPPEREEINYLWVPDTLKALQDFAYQYRKAYQHPIYAITGSNGKTIVKEWASQLLTQTFTVVTSPGSYNSQLGVALSLLQLEATKDIALIEAGISMPGEMSSLESMIEPDYMVLTRMGSAHGENFIDFNQKLSEKLILGKSAKRILTLGSQKQYVIGQTIECITIGIEKNDNWEVQDLRSTTEGWSFKIEGYPFVLNMRDRASLENVWLAILIAIDAGVPLAHLPSKVANLKPVHMRTEFITDTPNLTLINDAYTADADSIHNAFELLSADKSQNYKSLIITDLEAQGKETEDLQYKLVEEAIQRFGAERIQLIGPVFSRLTLPSGIRCWPDVKTLLSNFDLTLFNNSTLLLKGARRFELEQIIPFLTRNTQGTQFTINLSALVRNYRKLRAHSKDKAVMAMVKASAYGTGTWEVANTLAMDGLEYLAVAFTAEGILLREKGIQTPIMVMSPDLYHPFRLSQWKLEPVISSLEGLQIENYKEPTSIPPIHIEVDTGMCRLGFLPSEKLKLLHWVNQYPHLKIASIFTHLASAESEIDDPFTQKQIELLHDFAAPFLERFPDLYIHTQNTAGLVRKLDERSNLVRMGIGLYGISPVEENKLQLEEIGTLSSVIRQIHVLSVGESVGYNRKFIAKKESRIATIPIGYADGIPRSLSWGKGYVLIQGKKAPIAGTICMDLLMVDISDIPEAREGDGVVLIGSQHSEHIPISKISEWAGTIPYEILSGLSPRIQRVFIKD